MQIRTWNVWGRAPFRYPKQTAGKLKERIGRSLRAQLLVTVGACTLAGAVTFAVTDAVLDKIFQTPFLTYSEGVTYVERDARMKVEEIERFMRDVERLSAMDAKDPERLYYYGPKSYDEILNSNSRLKVILVDTEGNVLMNSKNTSESRIDLHTMFRRIMVGRGEYQAYSEPREVTSVYPVTFKPGYQINRVPVQPDHAGPIPLQVIKPEKAEEVKAYAVITGYPWATIEFSTPGAPFAIVPAVTVFLLLFYFLTKRKTQQIEALAGGVREIAKGNLDTRVAESSRDEIGSLAADINAMAGELQQTIEEERRAEKTKSELITNVSHDLRTPLTSIMGYLRLLQDKKYDTPEQLEEYIQIAAGKSERLKSLIEDLFEYTKLTNQGVRLHPRSVNLNQMLEQLLEELVPLAEERNITLSKQLPDPPVSAYADPNQLVRVFENLLTNAIKYGTAPGEVQAVLQEEEDHLLFSVQNKSDTLPDTEDLDRLFERFYKAELSRTTSGGDGGSGLGLAIAKSIVDLHGGDIWAERDGEQIRFFVKLQKT